MDLDGRRESENFEDRRGMSTGTMAGMGIGGMILIGIITLGAIDTGMDSPLRITKAQ